MIRYRLTCDQDHEFESWFQSSEAFDTLDKAGHLSCAVCGSSRVQRALMAPSVQGTSAPLAAPRSEVEAALAKIRQEVESNSEYVGLTFAQEARKIHAGEAPERAIYGEAKLADAKKLIEDGVPVAPLPFLPKRKTN
ncbi:DUF1178 family protein [Thalassorhabdomicrobium marinisediminis]|uniref:DUF1178 domain-containing protein n=1 Tax=Thalassorhabdomicrobium marinisediminis TaxID=2170577 RepID=A0A2T7FUB3_9RHOB|nr:DUF1178 family protein [Thalassorhabdomicrobium marinisediminis]PVA05758.1 DUF1178 domain-containing protein [Thalassorhabdomicrobium marinisediminis]